MIPVECATQPHVANAQRAELPSNVADLGGAGFAMRGRA